MAPAWINSALKHGIPQADQVWAIVHHSYVAKLAEDQESGSSVMLYIGNPHPQTDREVEILVRTFADSRQAIVFHAMELGPKFRKYRQEHPND